MANKKEKLLLFDADGVFIDSFEQIYHHVSKFIKDNGGSDVSLEEYRTFFHGNPLENIFKKFGGVAPKQMPPEVIKSFFQDYNKCPIFKGMFDVAEKLSVDNLMIIITSSLASFVEERLNNEGMLTYFAAFLGSEANIHKDKKINIAMDEFEKIPKETTFITDTMGDILDAKKTGVKTIGVTWGYHPRATIEKAKPDIIVDNPKELLNELM